MPPSAPCKLSAIDTLLTEHVRSRCVDIGRVHFGGFYGPRESRDPWNAKRRTRLISSCHLGRTGLVNKGGVVEQKDVLIKTKNDLFISKAGKEGQLCLWHNKPTGVVYVFYVLIVFLLLLFATPSPTLSKTLLLSKSAPRILFSLLVRDQSGQSRAGAHLVRLGGQSEHGIRFTLPAIW